MTIAQILSEEVVQALGWTVVHSLWQAPLLAAAAGVGMLLMHRRPARERYWLAVCALAGILAWAVVTFSSHYQPTLLLSGSVIATGELPAIATENSVSFTTTDFVAQFSQYFSENAPLIVTCWMLGMTFFLLKMLGALLYANQLKRRYVSPPADKWQQSLRRFANRIGIKRTVNLVESAVIKTPMTIGFFKPVILLPIGLVNNLSVEQVEAILAHELAHIYRCDFLVNIFQAIVETLFYFNPAVWWLSAAIRAEREDCCDDIAILHCNNSLDYAKALVSVQEWGHSRAPFALAFSGGKNRLLNRVRRILNHPQNKSNIMEKFTATCLLLLAVVVVTVSAAYPDNNSSDKATVCTAALDEPGVTAIDSLPKGNARINMEKEGKSLEAKVKDGVITYLKVDGKEIEPAEYSNYEDLVEEAFGEAPMPPMPPTPPGMPNMPNAPGMPNMPSMPNMPAPPAPPTPEAFFYTPGKDGEGTRLFKIERPDGEAPMHFEWKEGDQFFKLNGEVFDFKEGFPGGMGMAPLEFQEGFGLGGGEFPMIAGKELSEEMKLKLKAELKLAEQYQKGLGANKEQLKALKELQKHHKKEWSEERMRQYEAASKEMVERARAYAYGPATRDGNIWGYFEEGGRVDGTVESALEKALVRDGLIQNKDNYTLELTGKGMKINGKKQPDDVWEKYRGIYRGVSGFELSGKSKIVVDKDNAE